MKTKYLLSTLVAGALSLGACTESVDFVETTPGVGPGFSSANPSVVEVSYQANSFDVVVSRSETSGAATYNLVNTDEYSKFNVPSSVSFAEGSNETKLSIGYNPDDLEWDELYPLSISFGEGVATNNFALGTYSFEVVKSAPYGELIISDCTWVTAMWGPLEDFPYGYRESLLNPNIVEYIVPNFLAYDPEEWTFTLDKSTNTVYFPDQPTGWYNGGEDMFYIASVYDLFDGREGQQCTFDPKTGIFTLNLCLHTAPDAEGSMRWFGGTNIDYIQLPGYPDYSASVKYVGQLMDESGDGNNAVLSVEFGIDASDRRVAIMPGTDANALIEGILDESIEYSVPNSANETMYFPIEEPGMYVAAAVTVSNESVVGVGTTMFEVMVSAANADWELYATADLFDGWFIPLFGVDGDDGEFITFEPEDFPWTINVRRNKENHNLIRLEHPWTDDNCPMVGVNENYQIANIVMDITDPDWVKFTPQYSGLSLTGIFKDSSDLYIYSLAYHLEEEYGQDAVIEAQLNNIYDEFDDCIYIPFPTFGPSAEDARYQSSGSQTEDPYPTEIYITPLEGTSGASKIAERKERQQITSVQLNKRVRRFTISDRAAASLTSAREKVLRNSQTTVKFDGTFHPHRFYVPSVKR